MKILKNITDSNISLADVGITIQANSQYIIPADEYRLWRASNAIITQIGNSNIVVNDGNSDLSISDGVSLIKDFFPSKVQIQGSDGSIPTVTSGRLDVNSELTIPTNGLPITFNPNQLDIFGRQRVSEQGTLLEITFGEFIDYTRYISKLVANGGVVAKAENNNPSLKLSITTSTGSSAKIRTRRNVQYVKGNAQLIYIAGKFETKEANLVQRIGYFCHKKGLFFEQDGLTTYVVKRSSVSGTTVDTRVPQSEWNVDRLDGSNSEYNPSGLTYNQSKQTVYSIDFAWLSTLAVRYYITIGDRIILVHISKYSNLIDEPYMDSAQSPIAAEIFSTGTISGGKSLYITSATVKSEGKYNDLGIVRSMDTGIIPITITTTEKVVAGMRLKDEYVYGLAQPLSFSLMSTAGNNFIYYKVIYNPTLSGATWMDMEGICEGLTNNPSYSGGSVLEAGYLSMGNKNQISVGLTSILKSDMYLGVDLNMNPDALVIVMRGISGDGDIMFSGQFKEYI